jgi:hypothetical protein
VVIVTPDPSLSRWDKLHLLAEALTAVAKDGHILLLADLETWPLALELASELDYDYRLLGSSQTSADKKDRLLMIAFTRREDLSFTALQEFVNQVDAAEQDIDLGTPPRIPLPFIPMAYPTWSKKGVRLSPWVGDEWSNQILNQC